MSTHVPILAAVSSNLVVTQDSQRTYNVIIEQRSRNHYYVEKQKLYEV